MKRFGARLAIFLLAASPYTFGGWDLAAFDLHGPVRTVTSESSQVFYGSDGSPTVFAPLIYVTTYDEKGRMTRRTYYGNSGELADETALTWGRNGKISEHVVYSSDGSVGHGWAYIYDDRGLLVEEVAAPPQGEKVITKYTYFPDGANHEVSQYAPEGTLLEKYVCTYDPERTGGGCARYDEEGTLMDREVFKDDKESGKHHLWAYDSEANLRNHEVTPLEQREGLLERVLYGDKGTVDVHLMRFDNQVRITEFLSRDSRGHYGHEVRKYDDRGNLVEISSYAKGNVPTQSTVLTYKFDGFGNWTERTTWEVNLATTRRRAVMIQRRSIAYY